MKKILKLFTLGIISLSLAACAQGNKYNEEYTETAQVEAPKRNTEANYTFEDFQGYWASLDKNGATPLGNYIEIINENWEFYLIPNGHYWLSQVIDYKIEGDIITLHLYEKPSTTSEGGDYEASYQLIEDGGTRQLYDIENKHLLNPITQEKWDALDIMPIKDIEYDYQVIYEGVTP